MNKTYKKLDINKYMNELKNKHVMKEDDIIEFIDTAGTMIDRNDNYRATPSLVKSKKLQMILYGQLHKAQKLISFTGDLIMVLIILMLLMKF